MEEFKRKPQGRSAAHFSCFLEEGVESKERKALELAWRASTWHGGTLSRKRKETLNDDV